MSVVTPAELATAIGVADDGLFQEYLDAAEADVAAEIGAEQLDQVTPADTQVVEVERPTRRLIMLDTKAPLQAARDALAGLPAWSKEGITDTIEKTAAKFEINMGKLGQPIRVSCTGGSVSPPIDVTLWLIGQARTIERLDKALQLIAKRAQAIS